MQNKTIILDASVIVKWFHEEPDTREAERLQEYILQGEVRALIPPLLFYEVANALTLKAGSEVEEIVRVLRILEQMPFQVVEVIPALLEDAVRLANRHRISVYDAVYLALADFIEVTLITADKKLVNTVKSPRVQLLSEM